MSPPLLPRSIYALKAVNNPYICRNKGEILSGHGGPRRNRRGGQLGRAGGRDHQPVAVRRASAGSWTTSTTHMKRICDIVGPDCHGVRGVGGHRRATRSSRDGRELAEHRPERRGEDPQPWWRAWPPRAHAGRRGHPGEHDAVLQRAAEPLLGRPRPAPATSAPFVGRFDDISEDGLGAGATTSCAAIGN